MQHDMFQENQITGLNKQSRGKKHNTSSELWSRRLKQKKILQSTINSFNLALKCSHSINLLNYFPASLRSYRQIYKPEWII